uniref:Uncharacterized protein n=1 Tax=Pararge aegeria TaxID=116150 RepID=S4P776_9NEOP
MFTFTTRLIFAQTDRTTYFAQPVIIANELLLAKIIVLSFKLSISANSGIVPTNQKAWQRHIVAVILRQSTPSIKNYL